MRVVERNLSRKRQEDAPGLEKKKYFIAAVTPKAFNRAAETTVYWDANRLALKIQL